jgi:hypothetical protein
LRSDFPPLLLHWNTFACPQPPIAIEYVGNGVLLNYEIPLRLDVTAGISECSGIGLRVCLDGLVARLIELLDVKDGRPALASGPSDMQCISLGAVSDCLVDDVKEVAKC